MAIVAAWNGARLRFPSSLPRSLPPPPPSPRTNPRFPGWAKKKKQGPPRGSFCFALKPNQRREAEAEAEADELGGADGVADAFLSSARDDSNYLWKLAAGSVGGASAIKYGSILLPDITRPNIVQALVMVSLPVLVAVLILLKESMSESPNDDFM
ncbi:uncharacterized protein LOC109711266 [Ananas comosus]|uniref:Uncharacterized protein LOC109711266 n=1 Tax=Ananas comosus TaxID=4615 RepID=A0A6P5F8J9_ANACO|nr:uncharacterized protein LOC109711266 [Ananas comosus]